MSASRTAALVKTIAQLAMRLRVVCPVRQRLFDFRLRIALARRPRDRVIVRGRRHRRLRIDVVAHDPARVVAVVEIHGAADDRGRQRNIQRVTRPPRARWRVC